MTASAAADGFRQSRRNGWRSLQRLHRRSARQSLFRTLAGSVVVCDPVLARRALADVDGLFEHTPAFWCPREVPLEPPLRRQLTKWIRTAAEAQDVEAVGAAAVDEVAATGGDLHLACLRALAHANSAVLVSDDVPELEGVVREYVDTIAYPMIVGTARDNSRGRRIRQLSERAGEVLTRTRPPALPGVMIDGTTVDSWLAGRIYLESILAVVGGSSVALAWLTCMMSLPEVAGLRHDLDATRSAAPRDVAHEVLRLWPPAWQHRRHVRQDHKIGTVRVLRGDDVVVPVYSLHRRHDLWPNANAFDPHRWSTMASPPEAFLPFAAGPRTCVGARFEEHLLAAAARRLAARPRLPLTAMREEPCVTTALSPPPHLIRM